MSKFIDEIEAKQLKKAAPEFNVGDTVKVFSKIVEGGKERLQGFEGIVIKRQGRKATECFTVRRIVQGVGVERAFPVNSPKVDRVEVLRKGSVRRAKLFYLRKRIGGQATRVNEAAAENAATSE